jgi:predicted NAD/FAD-binding protein
MNKNRRVAVVGSGVSGAVTAWLLRDSCDVRLYEAEQRFGGHTHTFTCDDATGPVRVDTGFMVFNRPNYPLLSALFDHLDIRTYPTDMSFSASLNGGQFEYAGTDLNGLFGQRRNLVNVRFWGLLRSILKFNRVAQQSLSNPPAGFQTLDGYLDEMGLNEPFRERYLYPMAAAIWSCPRGEIGRFPAQTFLRFFNNHGLVQLSDRPQWHTVEGGSSQYMSRLIEDLGERAQAGRGVGAVERLKDHVELRFVDGSRERFDAVVLACHSDQALRLVSQPSASEVSVLKAIRYQPNRVVLHRDAKLMPRQRRVWSSWNYLSEPQVDASSAVSVTYWMNSLQQLGTTTNYFVSLNPLVEPASESVVEEFSYEHPVFSLDALTAQKQLYHIQGRDRIWFAGAWTGYGFHEDGMRSGVEIARTLGAAVPWERQASASRDLTLVPQIVPEAA